MRVALSGGSRVALFGGSFDPPHRGHVAIARAAADRFRLDTVFFVPAARQPLKQAGPSASYAQRLTMTALACAEDPERFAVSELDAPQADGAPNYTVDTLARLAEILPRATIFNLVGADSFRDLARWRDPERLLALAEWIVVSRPGFGFAGGLAEPEGMPLTAGQRARVHLLDSVNEEVSATSLRERLGRGEPCVDLLPPLVSAYIQQQGLYRAALQGSGAEPGEPLG